MPVRLRVAKVLLLCAAVIRYHGDVVFEVFKRQVKFQVVCLLHVLLASGGHRVRWVVK